MSSYPLPQGAAIIVVFIEWHGMEIGTVICLYKYWHGGLLEIGAGQRDIRVGVSDFIPWGNNAINSPKKCYPDVLSVQHQRKALLKEDFPGEKGGGVGSSGLFRAAKKWLAD